MAKRKRELNIDKMISEGKGQGRADKYKPWITIQDVPSLGRVTRLKGIKTGRQHEFLSDMEKNYFYFLEYSDKVVDIREQYPLLPIEETILIAKELGINHPKNPETGELIVMTTDFLISLYNKDEFIEVARTIKPKNELFNKRIIEKFEIERIYWSRRNIDWGIVTEKEINKTVAENIAFVHSYKNLLDFDAFINIDNSLIKDIIYEFIKRIVDSNKSLRCICSEFDKDMLLEKGSGISIFRYLIINKIVDIDITEQIDMNKVLNIISLDKIAIKKVEAI
ncbi:transposase [Clostridium botulinum]|uniref:TnsA endonuclease n=1 Tax=Clostridium botulinum C/D str. DC5 TaxID=1443128 RepID=A0A0A0IHK9_CLOBO|nr:heteromeric transposase endonuclease subunit TnsA [Clostridium botulinum]KGN00945.1 TnsA endonuclease [Clostridium botulinum C/D str. DC5]KOC52423.1 transposase [Clostridium botulinum]KOC55941.1 transposase [Clostridium botulinum]MCD3233278.1 heteromeric transposase endonuclease subunit TnsA [Clostridium botulinum D/C]MCD3239027.1 heteromeric transposase endonuclease subunit TnsA [Clostridium botulinum D/C]